MTADWAFLKGDYKRVIYSNNPLVSVVCQIRFPEILRIEADPPVAFQERISDLYPRLEIQRGIGIQLGSALPQDKPIRQSLSYAFYSVDADWHVSLTTGFLALATTKYERWEQFFERMEQVLSALCDSFNVSLVERVGLRYQDVIDKKELGLESKNWSELFNPKITALLSDGAAPENCINSFKSTLVYVVDDVNLALRTQVVEHPETKDKAFLLDTDYFVEPGAEFNLEKVMDDVNRLHHLTGPFFRWCIQDPLHTALNPREVE